MKLLAKTNRYYAILVGILLCVGAIGFYIAINAVIRHETEELLYENLGALSLSAKSDPTILKEPPTKEMKISPTSVKSSAEIISDTLMWNDREHELEPYLQLRAFREINGDFYQVTIRKSLIESEDIVLAISVVFLLLMLFIFIGIFIINKYLSRRLWDPFFQNIHQLQSYDLRDMNIIENIPTDIVEFRELNTGLRKMTGKIQADYKSLKEFTENASHEIQTPLAILKSGIDNLLQSNTNEKELDQLANLESVINRISKTNQALLILTKIENNQFTETSELDLAEMMEITLSEFADFAEAKNLNIQFENRTLKKIVQGNRTLYQILFSNLVSNAIKHNIENGYIKIEFEGDKICIENTGQLINTSPERLFDRFVKGSHATASPGLGLAIVKKICTMLKLNVLYQNEDSIHRITLSGMD